MKERPVIFNGEMVRAIIDGRKTQTRRVMAVQPESNQFGLLRITDSTKRSDIGKYHWAESNATGTHQRSALFSCPFGQVGDLMWVRETWTPESIDAEDGSYSPDYRATANGQPLDGRWTPSIHMPRWASRILLEITGVRVERLNDISEEDAKAEGVAPSQHIITPPEALYRVGFLKLWQSIYGEESWGANPWVWVIEFRRLEVRDASK